MRIELTPQEMYLAGLVGYRRNLESIVKKRTPRFPEKYPGEMFARHILGAMAECVVAKAFGMYWSPSINHFKPGDVQKLEVRYSQRTDLKIRERDTGIVVSVCGYPPTFEVAGWIEANEARSIVSTSQPRADGPPAYFVPHDDLRSPESLFNVIGVMQ